MDFTAPAKAPQLSQPVGSGASQSQDSPPSDASEGAAAHGEFVQRLKDRPIQERALELSKMSRDG
jgi:hypothetical protein